MTIRLSFVTASVLLLPSLLGAQDRVNVFANPENLQVLPKDISSQDLNQTMRGFAMGLGARCESCHIGEAGQPLSTFDFASDENPMKQKARLMMEMLNEINSTLVPALDQVEKDDRVAVRCVTCHRGRPQPQLIEDVLDEKLAEGDSDGAVAEYRKLRDEYYGSHSYDFSEFVLPMYAQGLAKRQHTEAAIAFTRLNLEYFPESLFSTLTLAEFYEGAGETASALSLYRRAVEINPAMEARIGPKIESLQE